MSPPPQSKVDSHPSKIKPTPKEVVPQSPRTHRQARALHKNEGDKDREQKEKSPGTRQEVIYF